MGKFWHCSVQRVVGTCTCSLQTSVSHFVRYNSANKAQLQFAVSCTRTHTNTQIHIFLEMRILVLIYQKMFRIKTFNSVHLFLKKSSKASKLSSDIQITK